MELSTANEASGLLLVDNLGRIRHASPGAMRAAGMPDRDLAGMQIREAIPGPLGARLAGAVEHALAERAPMRTAEIRPDGRALDIRLYPHREGVVIRLDLIPESAARQSLDLPDSALAGTFIAGPDGAVIAANDTFLRMTGRDHAEIFSGDLRMDLLADSPQAITALAALGEHGRCAPFELDLRRSDGASVPVLVELRPAAAPAGAIAGMLLDMSARTEMERMLRESEDRLALALGSAKMGTWEWNRATGITTWSKNMYELFGLEEGSGNSRTFLHGIHPDDLLPVQDTLRRTIADRKPFELEFRIVHPNGTVRWIQSKGRSYVDATGRVCRITGINLDVTERKRAVEELRASEARLAGILDIAEDAIISVDERQRIRMFNQGAERAFGYRAAEVLGRPLTFLLPERTRATHAKLVRAFSDSGDVTRRMGERREPFGRKTAIFGRRSDGTEFPAEASISKLVTNREIIYTAIVRDVSQSEQANEALRRSEQEYRRLFEQAHDAIIIFTPEDEIVLDVNERACELYGFTRKEFVGISLLSLTPEPARGRAMLAETMALKDDHHTFETRQRRKDGQEMMLEVNAATVEYKGRRAILSINRDLTDRRQLEQQLLQSQKMEAIGRLAGGVAHDFNNILTAITGYADLALRNAGSDEVLIHDLIEVKRAADRAASFTRQLLAVSRQQVIQPKLLALTTHIAGSVEMLRRVIGEHIELRTNLAADAGAVLADAGQIDQVILNLVVNARDAMPDGGTITIETDEIRTDDGGTAHLTQLRPGRYHRLRVSDTGSGMEPRTISRCFEPFFTTKGSGKGTGLGLSTVYGIVKQCDGEIEVRSVVGRGTTFTIYLPVAEVPESVEEIRHEPRTMRRGTETILLAEDDPALRILCHQILANLGYAVLTAAEGEEALLVAEASGREIRMLVTDVVMPGMGGRQLAEEMKRRNPSIILLYMSGHTDDELFNRGILNEEMAFLQKPFTPDQLAWRVHDLFEAGPRSDSAT
jgi:PAS domain S-box-containing protein